MKSSLRIIIVAVFMTAGLVPLQAQWVKLNGPFHGGRATSLLADGPNLLAGTSNGIFYSTDRGRTWTQAYKGSPEVSIDESGYGVFLAKCGDLVFASSQQHGVFRSADHGISWTAVNNGLTDSYGNLLRARDIAVLDTTLFVVTATASLFRSSDYGDHWTAVNTDSMHDSPYTVTVSGTNLFVRTISRGVFLSVDKGATWTSITAGLHFGTMQGFAAFGPDLFFATDSGVFRSHDNGASWSSAGAAWPRDRRTYGYYSIARSGTNLFIGLSDSGVYRSSDDGAHWKEIGQRFPQPGAHSIMAVGTEVMVSTYHGLFRSSDQGEHWDSLGSDFNACYVTALARLGRDLFAGTYYDGVFRSTDDGVSWTQINNGLTTPEISAVAVEGEYLYAANWSRDGSIFRSADNGRTWTDISIGALQIDNYRDNIDGFIISGTDLFAVTSLQGVFRSRDHGAHWTKASAGLPEADYLRDVTLCRGILYAIQNKGLYRSVNNGDSWDPVENGLTDAGAYIFTLGALGTQLFAGTSVGAFRSADGGSHWIAVNAGLPSDYGEIRFSASGGNIFSVKTNDVYLSTDRGGNWKRITDQLPMKHLDANLAATGEAVFVYGRLGSIWKRMLSDESDPTLMPTRVSLDQNYPNPFNPVTSIKFNLVSDAFVTLKIYDVLGREAATLASEALPAGTHVRAWNAAGYSSGVYFCRLLTGSFTDTKKMLLVR